MPAQNTRYGWVLAHRAKWEPETTVAIAKPWELRSRVVAGVAGSPTLWLEEQVRTVALEVVEPA